jgi:hypothetical protein
VNPLLRPHCRSCQCVTVPVTHQPTNAAAGVPNIQIIDVTVGAQPFVVQVPVLPGAAGAMPPATFERITVRT